MATIIKAVHLNEDQVEDLVYYLKQQRVVVVKYKAHDYGDVLWEDEQEK